MKKRLLSAVVAFALSASAFGALTPAVSAAPVQGVEYSIDFSEWTAGDYTVDSIAAAAADSGFTVTDYNTTNSSMTYSVVKDNTLGTNVLQMVNGAATIDGLKLTPETAMRGKNISYFVKSMTTTTGNNGIWNKVLLNGSTQVVSGQLAAAHKNNNYTGVQVYNGTSKWVYPDAGYDGARTWLAEQFVVNDDTTYFMYLTDKLGRTSYNGSYNYTKRNNKTIETANIYAEKAITAYIAEVGFRTFPTVIDTAVYGGETEYTDTSAVSTSITSVKAEFDHYMDASTFTTDNIKLYNVDTASYEALSQDNISYDADTFTLTVKTGELAANTDYEIRLTGGIANTDNIALEEKAVAFTTGASAMELVSFKVVDAAGNDLGTDKVITLKAKNAVLTANNAIATANVTVNSVDTTYTKSEDGKSIIIPLSLEQGSEYTVTVTGITDTIGAAMADQTLTFTTNEASVDYFYNGFQHITAEAGTMLNAADLLPADSNMTIVASSTDEIFEVVDNNGDKSIKVSQPLSNKNAYGIKLDFGNDLFSLLGNENVVVELDYYVDETTLSTYAAFARMNNTASLYVQNNILTQQRSTNLELKSGMNGVDTHYKMVLSSDATLNLFVNGERIAYDGSYDIPFRDSGRKPTCWEIYINNGDPTYYTIDNLRIRNYPMASLAFKNAKETTYSSTDVVPDVEAIYVNFDNIMNADTVTADSFALYDSDGNKVDCTVSAYDAAERRVTLMPEELDMGETYEVRIDEGVANSDNKVLGENVITFTTLNVEPVKIEEVNVTDYNKLEVEFSDYISTLAASDISVDGFAVSGVTIARNPENYAKHKAEITVDGVLNAGTGKVTLTGGSDEYGRNLAGIEGTYTAEDKLYVSSVDFALEGSSTEPKVSIALLGGSGINSAVVVGAYYENGSDLKSVNYKECKDIQAGAVTQVSAGVLDTTAGENGASGCVEVFIWNSLGGMKPLCEKIRVMKAITVHLVGDSKVCEYYEKSYPQQGWGHYLADYLIDSASVNNKAQSGTTTTTFRTGKIVTDSKNPDEIVYSDYKPWEKITEVLKAGDYVIIDLAHNDKYSSNSGANDIDAYKENIRGYVDEIRSDYNAIPILMSTVPHVRAVTNELADYGAAMKEVAEEKGTAFLDVNAVAFAEFEELGIEGARNTFYLSNWALKNVYNMSDADISVVANSSLQNNGYDYIHFSLDGAKRVASIVAEELAKCGENIALYVK